MICIWPNILYMKSCKKIRYEWDLNLTLILSDLYIIRERKSIINAIAKMYQCALCCWLYLFTPSFIIPRLTVIVTSPVNRVALFSIHTVSTFFRTSGPILAVLALYKVHLSVGVYHKTLSDGVRISSKYYVIYLSICTI